MIGVEQTPGERHAAIAREVVELARKHGMDHLTVSFSARFNNEAARSDYYGRVTATWVSGRHGTENRIRVTFEGALNVDESPAQIGGAA